MSSPTTYDPQHTIAFMGMEGANADLACRQSQPYMQPLPCASFEDVFEAVEQGRASRGMIPIENSQAGRVAEIHNLLPRTGLHIVGEFFQSVEHCLVAIAGATPESLKEVYSHPQALMQCRQSLRALKLTTHPYSNTAQAAADVARWQDKTKAAIASSLAAELYGLQVLRPAMQDSNDNITVYILIARESLPLADKPMANPVTTLLFTVRNIPAALYKTLGGFATNGVNILKLESYIPPGLHHSSAQFFLSFLGSPLQQNVKNALEELEFYCKNVRHLGTYPADPRRFE